MGVSQQVTRTASSDPSPTVTVTVSGPTVVFRQGPGGELLEIIVSRGGERWSSAESPAWPDWVMAAVAAARARVTADREVSR